MLIIVKQKLLRINVSDVLEGCDDQQSDEENKVNLREEFEERVVRSEGRIAQNTAESH